MGRSATTANSDQPPTCGRDPTSCALARRPDRAANLDFLAGGGEMAELIRAKDWSATPLGPIVDWPQSLRTAVSLCLASTFPISMTWGPQHVQIYNDGYWPICGAKHPHSMGMDFRECWASAWPVIGAAFETALAGQSVFLENQRIFIDRYGYLEETFFTFSFSPIRDESGGIGGLFHPVTETTRSMLLERRTRAVRDLNGRLARAKTPAEVFAQAAATLTENTFDLPFVLLYQFEESGQSDESGGNAGAGYRLAARTGIATGTAASPPVLAHGVASPYPLDTPGGSHAPVTVTGLAAMLRDTTCGPYEEPPDCAVMAPIGPSETGRPAALMIAGVSPRLPFDDAYRGFYELVAAALANGLANAQAYEAERRRAEALAVIDRAKTAFFSNISHEFRTPLTLLLGPVEDALADAAPLPPAQRERLQVAHRNALRLLRLVNSLLDFSRIEAGRVQARFEPTDLAGLTIDLASNFRSACERAGLDLRADCPPLGAPVHVDREMWEKIVLNLLSNAFKYTLDGGIAVSLRNAGAVAELVVRDSGVGIAAEELPRLFERFHRIEGQRGRTQEGSGIGLALVEELVRLHGGKIGVTSTPGHGTTFTVTVPFGTAHLPPDRIRGERVLASTAVRASAYVEEALRWLPDDAAPAPACPVAEAPDAVAGGPRILLADDNSDVRAYVAQILRQGGYAVETVCDGAAALAALRRGPLPDLLLSDVMMPVMDGFALLRTVRADPAMEGLLVILLSARAGEEARVEGLSASADDYLVKPFSARELRARIDAAVTLARHRREAAERERDLRAELAAERGRAALRESEQRLELAMRAGGMGSWELDLATDGFTLSPICREHFCLGPQDQVETRADIVRHLHPDDRARAAAAREDAVGNDSALDIEYRVIAPDGAIRWLQVRGHAIYGPGGVPLRLIGVSLDVTARKRDEERLRLLLAELNHRVKNTLATVQSIVAQTRRSAPDPAAFMEDVVGRIMALARVHELLTAASWDGASLADVVTRTLAPYAGDAAGTRRVRVEGPPVTLGPTASVTLAMTFHELVTNAAKYGSLSVAGGEVQIAWRIEREGDSADVVIDWCESGGPGLAGPPRRHGFGTRLIERGMPAELGGEVRMDFTTDGLHCYMCLPVSAKIMVQA
ncbi:response regulator [Rhodovastum atsumiense]|uniref:histidine kinase n=2 Tax=Rhodovastum atsumiense TaxID=504468 RepID=A0A5M6ITS4_9PROT|nr:response regulator [Rhodovastum atsumiense]